MKTFKVPLVDYNVSIFIGVDEWKTFVRRSRVTSAGGHPLPKTPIDFDGLCAGTYIWVRDYDINTITHEISHCIDVLIDALGADGEGEFRAYMTGDLSEKVLSWMMPNLVAEYKKKLKSKKEKRK